MKKKSYLLLFGILILASLLRVWALGSVPPSPDWDEVALGYNAYSLLQTGRDEYGEQLPIILRSFGDYKPALYAYLAIPFIGLFGLDTFAVRLPSAIFGILTVLAVFFLIKELAKREDVALLSALVLAISPWHIQFSRVAFETNIGVSLSIFAALFFLYGLRKNIFLFLSAICLGLGLYAYQSEKVFVPLFALGLIIIFFKELRQVKRNFLIGAVCVGLIISLPMLVSMLGDSTTLLRARDVSVFNQQSDDYKINAEKLIVDRQTNDGIGLILDNRRILFAKQIIENYLLHFDLNWLFITGDMVRHHAPGMGNLYLIELPFLLIGIYSLLFKKYPRKMKLLLFFWILLAPVPAAITKDVPHAVRVFHMIPAITTLVAIGIYETLIFMRRHAILAKVFIPIIGLLYMINIFYYLNQYFVQLPYFTSKEWQFGYKEAVQQTERFAGEYDSIVVSNKVYLDQSYIFYLFYLTYPPKKYQTEMQFINNGTTDRKLGKYEFRPIDWLKDKDKRNTLFVGMPGEFPEDTPKKRNHLFLR